MPFINLQSLLYISPQFGAMPLVCFWHGKGLFNGQLVLYCSADNYALLGGWLHCIAGLAFSMVPLGHQLGVHVQSLSEEIFYSEDVERVVQMQLKLGYGNWAAFFQLATNATYLQGCLAHMYFQGVRARAVNAIAAAGKRAWDVLVLLTVTQNVHEILTGHQGGAALHRTQC